MSLEGIFNKLKNMAERLGFGHYLDGKTPQDCEALFLKVLGQKIRFRNFMIARAYTDRMIKEAGLPVGLDDILTDDDQQALFEIYNDYLDLEN